MFIGRLPIAFALFISFGAARAATYTVTDLGTLGGSQSSALGLNSSGQVVGQAYTTGNSAADPVLFGNPNAGLGTFGGAFNQANAINTAGVIVGTNSLPGNLSNRGFVALGKTVLNLGTLGGTSSRATGINDAGQITGEAQIAGNTATHAFRYQNGTMTDLGGGTSIGYGINASGHVVGQDISGSIRAFLAISDTIVPLGTLGTGSSSAAYAINDNEQIVGESNLTFGGSTIHAFHYQNGAMVDLGALGTGTISRAYAINNAGLIVGESNLTPGGGTFHAFLYDHGQMTDLNTLLPANSGWELTTARAINASGQIAGSGIIGGQTHAYLLSPIVPAPPSPPSTGQLRIYINGGRRVFTEKPKLRVEGSVGGPVASVKYRIGKGAYTLANGGTNGWRFKARLRVGRNVIFVIAIASDGRTSAPDKVIIVRQSK